MTTDTQATFDFTSAYTAAGWAAGIAWRATGYVQEWTEERWEYDGEGDPDDEASYCYCEPEQVEDRSRVVAHMVGDDRDFDFDISDLTPIADDDYCSGCGQVGCGWC